MITSDAAELAGEWVAHWSKDETPAIAAGVGASAVDWEIPREKPELCWDVILEILNRIEPDPSNRLFQVLAAGPLEDLLANHGEAFVERVTAQAAKDPRFARLLGGVWRHTMSAEVWSAVQASKSESW